MIIRYWDDATGCWAVGDSVFDGKVLPFAEENERFWLQKEALLGQGSLERGKHLSKRDMQKAKNVLPCDYGVWSKSPQKAVICPCGRTLLKTDVQKRCVTCRICRAAKRKLRRRAGVDGDHVD